MDAESAARRWAETWEEAWRAKDADAVASLYAADAVFRSEPFREPHLGADGARDYALWAFSEQDEAEAWFGQPIVSGDRAAVEYWGIVTFEGRTETIAGVAVIRFGPDGTVVEQRDCWNAREGRYEPPPALRD